MEQIKKLRWKCRRGTLELDLLLERYLIRCYAHADDEEKNTFLDLLDLEDIELQPYLTGDKEPDQQPLTSLVRKIRNLAAF